MHLDACDRTGSGRHYQKRRARRIVTGIRLRIIRSGNGLSQPVSWTRAAEKHRPGDGNNVHRQ